MTIGVLYVDFLIPDAHSLKDKRRVLKSLKDLTRKRFNCSVAEVDYQDTWRRSSMAFCVVSNVSRHANTQLNQIVDFVSTRPGAEMVDYSIEML